MCTYVYVCVHMCMYVYNMCVEEHILLTLRSSHRSYCIYYYYYCMHISPLLCGCYYMKLYIQNTYIGPLLCGCYYMKLYIQNTYMYVCVN